MTRVDPVFAGIEAGGTKCLVGIADATGASLEHTVIPTTDPNTVFSAICRYLSPWAVSGALRAIGVGAFGPIRIAPSDPDHGRIITTPKPGWSGVNVIQRLAPLGVPVLVDTDVGAAALGEHHFGAGRGLASVAYVTVGTGIGVGLVAGGRIFHGANHLEFGHIRPARAFRDDFSGVCPFHGDCLEGLASGPALQARAGRPAESLTEDDPVWAIEAHYLSELCVTLTYGLQPDVIVLGGGVAMAPSLIARVREAFSIKLGGYGAHDRASRPDSFLAASQCRSPSAGLQGAYAMALAGR